MANCAKCGFNAYNWLKICPKCGNSITENGKTNNGKIFSKKLRKRNYANKIFTTNDNTMLKKKNKKQIVKNLLLGLILIIVGLGLMYLACHGDNTYNARAGDLGGGVEGFRDASGPFFAFGIVAVLLGLVSFVEVLRKDL